MHKKAKITFLLEERSAFPWFGDDQCRVRGSFFDSSGKYYSGDAMCAYFGVANTFSDFSALVAHANGIFSVIKNLPGECWLATDLIRSLPLFYCKSGPGWMVSENAERLLRPPGDYKINPLARMEFRGSGYVTGKETLVRDIFQVQAGEVISLGKKVSRHFHHTYRTPSGRENATTRLKTQAKETMERTFSRMVNSLKGRTAVVPLSGGFDSRLIAVMLKRAGYRNVVCFTYGRKGNAEAAISEHVAWELGFPWYYVEYDQQLIGDYIHDDEFKAYYRQSSSLTSMFYLQEYFAVKYLRDHHIIPQDAVFIPGHSGDFLGGSQFAKHDLPVHEESVSALARRILEVKYEFDRYRRSERRILQDRIREQLVLKGSEGSRSYSVHEDWDLKEKFAKFNVNSVRIYTFFGYAFRLPYFDRELVNFFRDLPVEVKRDKSLYDDLLTSEYFVPAEVYFEKELQTTLQAYARARFRARIKQHLPRMVLTLLPKRADVLCYREITAQLRKDLLLRGGRPAAYGSKYNKMIIDWYLFDLEERVSL